jgi:hypothetical protein
MFVERALPCSVCSKAQLDGIAPTPPKVRDDPSEHRSGFFSATYFQHFFRT